MGSGDEMRGSFCEFGLWKGVRDALVAVGTRDYLGWATPLGRLETHFLVSAFPFFEALALLLAYILFSSILLAFESDCQNRCKLV
jgi:hypothetical protein